MLVFLSSCILQRISQLHLHWKVYLGRDMIIGLLLLLLRTLQILHQYLLLLNVGYKGPSSQGYGFSSGHVWMWELDYKAERWRIDAFELWCWRRLLRVPWTAKRSNQSVLKEISPEYSLEGLILKLKLQYFGHLMWRADSVEKTLMLGKIEGGRRGDGRG